MASKTFKMRFLGMKLIEAVEKNAHDPYIVDYEVNGIKMFTLGQISTKTTANFRIYADGYGLVDPSETYQSLTVENIDWGDESDPAIYSKEALFKGIDKFAETLLLNLVQEKEEDNKLYIFDFEGRTYSCVTHFDQIVLPDGRLLKILPTGETRLVGRVAIAAEVED